MRADLQTGRGQPSNTGPGLDRDTASRTAGTLTFLPIMPLFLLSGVCRFVLIIICCALPGHKLRHIFISASLSSSDRFADVCQQSFLGPQDKILDRDTFPFWPFMLLFDLFANLSKQV